MKTKKNTTSCLPANARDLRRLAWEATEELNLEAAEMSRVELMQLLRRIMRAGIESLKQAENTVSFAEAAQSSIEARAARRPTTKRDLRHFVRRMLKVTGASEQKLRAFTVEECRRILNTAFAQSLHSFRKGRAIMHSIFAFGMKRGWCNNNPVDDVDVPSVAEKEISPLQPADVSRLLRTARHPAHREMQLPLFLMLYCGIRPAEVQRLRPQDIDWDERIVHIRAKASKTGGGRIVPLRCCPPELRGCDPAPHNWLRRWHELRRDAGFLHWVPDILRHTFASYHAFHYKDLPALQIEMGHRDVSLLRTRYVNTYGITRKSARLFWHPRNAEAAPALLPPEESTLLQSS